MTALPELPLSRPTGPGIWNAILDQRDSERAEVVLQSVSGYLRSIVDADNWPADANPHAPALATLLAYSWLRQPDASLLASAERALNQATEQLSALPLAARLYGGYSGTAWTLSHLATPLFGIDPADFTRSVDDAVDRVIELWEPGMCYDLIGGLVGFGVHALERHSRSGDEALARIVAQLARAAIELPGGLAWHTPIHLILPRYWSDWPAGYYNLGVAHGVPGVSALLSRIVRRGAPTATAEELLTRSIDWLLLQHGTDRADGFPVWCHGQRYGPPAPVRWCYGSLGNALVLLDAADAVGGQEQWHHAGLRLAHQCAEDWSAERTADPGLCHGAAGNAHLFNRLFQHTHDEIFLVAARRWYARLLDLHSPRHGGSGFRMPMVDGSAWVHLVAFLEGDCGIGLSLLSALGGTVPNWDRLLLTDLPPRSAK